jgi:hypothetical protein
MDVMAEEPITLIIGVEHYRKTIPEIAGRHTQGETAGMTSPRFVNREGAPVAYSDWEAWCRLDAEHWVEIDTADAWRNRLAG